MDKKTSRLRRACRARATIKRLGVARLSVHRTPQHIYAQVLAPCGGRVLAVASSLDKQLRDELAVGGNVSAAQRVGALVAARALAQGVTRVAFDRSGFRYHGRVKALADAAREAGLLF